MQLFHLVHTSSSGMCPYVLLARILACHCLLQLKELRPRMHELLSPFALKAERLSRTVSVKAEALGNALNRRFNLSEKVHRDRSKTRKDN